MAKHAGRIDRDLMDEPHLAGHRVSVRRVQALVEERDLEPRAVADRLGLDIGDVYRALAYYHDNPGEMHEVEQHRAERIEQSRENGAVTGPEDLQMGFSLLLDEMTEASLEEYSHKLGHDVERVVDVSELGPGSDDADIVAYAERENHILVTYDDDFLVGQNALDRIGILFQADDRTPPFETANIIDAIADQVDQRRVVESESAFHLTTAWL